MITGPSFSVEGWNNFIHCGFIVDILYIKVPHVSTKLERINSEKAEKKHESMEDL